MFLPIALGIALTLTACSSTSEEGCPDTGAGPSVSQSPTPRDGYTNPTAGGAVALQIRGMDRACVTRDLTYVHRRDGALELDIYKPASSTAESLPVVLLGGPPEYNAGKDSGQKVGWAQLVASEGLAAAAFDIRSDNFQRTPADPSRDIAAAIDYLRRRAGDLGLDGDRMCTFGFSIGTAPWHLWAAMREPQPFIRCNVVYYGPLDFFGDDWSIARKLAGKYSATTYLRRDGAEIAPMLVAEAGQDENAGINPSIKRFVRLAERLGAPVLHLVHPNGAHAFDVEQPDLRTSQIMRATLRFLRHHLRGNA